MKRERLAQMTPHEKRRYMDALHTREAMRCKERFRYYFTKWVKTRDEHDKLTPIKAVPDKEYIGFLCDEIQDGEDIQYIAKSRQLMVSWILCGYADWHAQFHAHQRICFQSKKLEDAAEMIFDSAVQIARASFILANLPEWLQICVARDKDDAEQIVPIPIDNRTFTYGSIKFPNGSRIDALAQGAAQVESKVPSIYICDEASLQDEWEYAQAAAIPCLSGGGRGITVGTMRLPSAYGTEVSTAAECDPDGVLRGVARFRSKSGVASIRVHYSADPAKDPKTKEGAAWFAEETARMPGGYDGTLWQQHMEINPLSVSGERCIPFWYKIRDRVVIEDLPAEQIAQWSMDSGFDYGARNPSVWLVFANDFHGNRFLVHEMSVPGNEVDGIAGLCQLMKEYPLFYRLNGRIHADPSLWNKDQNTGGGLVSKAQLFSDQGVYMQPAKTKGQEADDVMLGRLKGYYWSDWEDVGFEPKFFICQSAKATLAAIPKWMYREWNDAAQKEHGLQEKMKDRDVDQFDAMKYAEVARPQPAAQPRAAAPVGSFNWLRRAVLSKQRDSALARS